MSADSAATEIEPEFTVETKNMAVIKSQHFKGNIYMEISTDDDGKGEYVTLSQKEHWLARLLCIDGTNRNTVFSYVTVIDTIRDIRDSEYYTKTGKQKNQTTVTRATRAKEIELGGSAVSIEVPSIGGSEPRTMKVLLDPPKSAPRVELSAGNLEWLARVIKIERAANTRKRPAEEITEEQTSAVSIVKESISDGNVASVKRFGGVRVTRVTDDGDKERTYIPVDLNDPQKAVEAAREFVDGATKKPVGRPAKYQKRTLLQFFQPVKKEEVVKDE